MELIENFGKYFSAVLGRSERTCTEYMKCALHFASWLEPELSPSDVLLMVTRQDVIDYLVYCDSIGNSASTRAAKISYLRGVFNYLLQEGRIVHSPVAGMPRPKYYRPLPTFLSLEDSIALVESTRSSKDDFYSARNSCIVLLFVCTAMRLSELASIQYGDLYNGAVRIKGKGGKERYLPFTQSCTNALSRWLLHRGRSSGPLFTSKQGGGLLPSSVASVVKGELSRAGLDVSKISTHKLRHTAATLLHAQGVDIRILQEILGHSSIATTEIYTHVVDEQIREAMSRHPLADF